jgi:hypothetical protein
MAKGRIMINIFSKCVIGMSALFFLNASAQAAVVYDNFGSGMSFDVTNGQGLGSKSDGEYGLSFTPSESGYVSRLTVAVSSYSGAGEVIFSLYDDNLGKPGTVLESFGLSNLPDYESSFSPQIMTASGTTYLDSSQPYWLIGSQPNHPDTAVWQSSTVLKDTLIALRNTQFTSWMTIPHEQQWTLRVETGEVPIPSAVWLFGSGLLGLIGVARRKKVA